MIRARRSGLLGLWMLALVPACAPPKGETPPVAQGQQALSGELEVSIVDHVDGTSARRYRLLGDGHQRRRLDFAEDPELAPGTRLTVWGDDVTGVLRVSGYKELARPEGEEVDLQDRALIGAPVLPTRKLAFVLVDLGGGINITADEAKRHAFGMAPGDQSMKQVLSEYSFGRLNLEGDVLGPFKTTLTACDEDSVSDALQAMVPAGYDNVVWYFGQSVKACDWLGIAPLGRLGKIADRLYVNANATCRVATHEFGHNLGLQHAARLRCTGAAMVDDLSTCKSSEYGDSDDVMGDGCNHYNAYSKTYLSWFERCNGVQAKSSGTFTLLPVESACNGAQVLIVPMAKARKVGGTTLQNYVLEYRGPIGLDAKLGPTVLVRLAVPVNQMRSGQMTWILDADPATSAIDGFKQGETFTDPAGGISFTVMALSATSASVKVDITGGAGPNTCLDGTPFVAPGPDTCGNAAPAGGPVVTADGGASADAGSSPSEPDAGGTRGLADAGTRLDGKPSDPDSPPTTAPSADAGAGGLQPTRDGGAMGTPPDRNGLVASSSGCSCHVGGPEQRPGLGLALGILFGLAMLTRRRGRRP